MWNNFSSIILRQRIPILVTISILTLVMAFFATRVKMNYEMYSVLPPGDSVLGKFEKFKRQFGQESSVLVLGLDSKKIFDLEVFSEWQELCAKLKKVDGVDEVLAVPTIAILEKNTSTKEFELVSFFPEKIRSQEDLDSLLNKFYDLPFYEGLIYDFEREVFLTALTLDRSKLDSKDRKELMDEINTFTSAFSEKNGIEIFCSGLPFIRSVTTSQISNEIQIFILLAGFITALIMYLFFRSVRTVMISMLIVMIGVVWAMGWMGIFGYKITMLTGLIPPLIIVIGIPNTIFILNKYHQEYRGHGNQIKALSRVIQKIGIAIFLTNFTTALGIASFIITDSRILVEFGIVTSIGIMSEFLISLTLMPIIYSFLKAPVQKQTKHLENRFMAGIIEKIISLVLNHRNLVYAGIILLALTSVYGISRIRTSGNIADDLPREEKVFTDLLFLEKHFNGVIPFEVMIDTKKKGKALQLSTLKKIEKLQKLISTYDLFSKPLSIVDGIKFSRQAFYNYRKTKYGLYNDQDKSFLAPYLTKKGGNSKMLNSFVDSNRQITRIAVQMKDVGTGEMDNLLRDLRPRVDSIFNPETYDVTLTGTSVIFLEGTKYLVKNLFSSLLLAIVVISFLMSFIFRSLRMILISLLPNLLPLVVTAGMMGFMDVPLKPSTLLIFSIAFGISIDDTIHFLAKFKQELKAQRISFKISVIEALRETGYSMIYTSVVLFFGFSVFTVSDFGGTVALGFLISFTLLVAMISNLIMLPSLLLTLDKRITTKAFEKEALLQILDEEEDIELSSLDFDKTRDQ